MASGSPSRRRQRRATACWFASATVKPGTTAAARSANSRSAGKDSTADGVSSSGAGAGRGGTSKSCSPASPSRCRLVARIRTPSVAASTVPARTAQLRSRCSQLSSTMSRRRSRRWSTRISSGGRTVSLRTPSASFTACGTNASSLSAASCTSHTPSGKARATCPATCPARRVLPTPPGPVSVSSLPADNNRLTPAASSRRPTKLVSSAGNPEVRRDSDPPTTLVTPSVVVPVRAVVTPKGRQRARAGRALRGFPASSGEEGSRGRGRCRESAGGRRRQDRFDHAGS